MRLLRLIRGGSSLFKKVRIGFTLLKSSFKSVFFSHQHYFLFCIMLAAIQFIHLKITGLIHHRLTLGVIMTEVLAGEIFFEILWHDAHFTLSGTNFFTLLSSIVVLYMEIILVFFVLCAVAQYTLKQNNISLGKSIQTSSAQWRGICAWGLLELSVQGVSFFLGDVGALIYFAWNLITIFDIQILAFDRGSTYYVLKKSWTLFIQTFSEIVAFDVIIEALLIIIGLGIYAVSKQYIVDVNLIGPEHYNDIVIFLMLYLISSVMIFEAVVFTKLYKARE